MSAIEECVQSPEDAVPTAEEPSSHTSDMDSEAFERMFERDRDGLFQVMKRFNSSKEFDLDGSYARRAFVAELRAWHTRDTLEKKFHEMKTVVVEEYEELPFRNLASADGQDETTTACTGPNPYNYPHLLPDPSAIRLVVLLPSRERHADIVCELCNSALAKIVSDGYEALSYVWGDPTRRRPIIVSRKLFQATENLEAALRNLRYPTKPRVLWIDAICINQNDVRERNEQVQLMGHIYRCARRVIVWLGPESDTSGAAFQLMRNKPDVPDFASASRQEIDEFLAAFAPGLMGFCWLGQRPWFRRVWCIQELILARAVDFQCGQHCATMNDFLWMHAMTFERRLLFANEMFTRTELRRDVMVEWLAPFLKLAHLHRRLLTDVSETGPNVKLCRSALDLLTLFQDWQCSNDKDRIFALYGLAEVGSPDSDALRPNYTLSVAQVYIRFAVRYLQHHKDLNILVTATKPLLGFLDISGARELPSWVPDWRDVPRHGTRETYVTIGTCDIDSTIYPFLGREHTVYDACLSMQAAPLKFLNDFRTLCLDGVVVDKIEEIGPAFLKDDQQFRQKPQVFSAWEDIASLSDERDYPFTGESSYEAFWRTLQADSQFLDLLTEDDMNYLRRHHKLPAHRQGGPMRSRIPPRNSDLPDGGDNIHDLGTLALQHGPALGRRFFRTAKGLIGLGPVPACVADDVAVLFGGKAPFILRPDGESRRVIGECYVHGIMDGEAIHRPRRREFTDLSTKEFHLV